MKKIISVLICLLTISLCLTSFGANVSYTVSPANVTVSIPESFYVFTRDTSPDDTRFSSLGFSYDTMMGTFNQQDIYLQAMGTESGNQKEIVLICSATKDSEYSDVTALYNAAVAEGNALEKEGKTVIAEDIFESGGIDYVMVEYSDIFTCREYITVRSGMKIRLRLTDYEGDITSNEEDEFEAIVKTMTFAEEKKAAEEPEEEVPQKAPEKEPEKTQEKEASKGLTKEMKDRLLRILIIIGASLVLITLPALIMRLFLFRKGLSRGASKVFAIIYSIVVSALILYLAHKGLLGNISPYIAIIPLLWSFVIYKIVKH